MTPKQWHRFYIEQVSKFIKDTSIDGCFIECGVKQGTSSVIMAKTTGKNGILFDTWSGFPGWTKEDAPTKGNRKRVEKRTNRPSTKDECIENLTKNGVISQCVMVQGDILNTVPSFDKESLKIALMHIDTDIYMPAKISLDNFWQYMAHGGVIVIHDYADAKWPGIKQAIDEFRINNPDAELLVFERDKLHACILVKGNSDSLKGYIGL